jgi:MFS family permease
VARRFAPTTIVICGCLIAIVTLGPRAAMGLFLQPMTQDHQWGRDVFALAIAIQNLLWGAGQPLTGAIADRFGVVRSICLGAMCYTAGLVLMAYANTPELLHLSAGVLIGFGLSGASFNIVLSAFGKLLPIEWRSVGYGAGTAAGSFGQFLYSPLAVALLGAYGWQTTLLIFGGMMLLVLPLSFALTTDEKPDLGASPPLHEQSIREALGEAFGHRSYVMLVLGFFVCGFHVAFITTHLPPYLLDKGLNAYWGGWVIGSLGLFNIFGAISAGWLSDRYPKHYLLSSIYLLRAVALLAFLLAPVTPVSALMFGAAMGLLWLSTVPPTSALVALMFGPRYMATLFGLAFFFHQIGAFLGVWLGGVIYERQGSYNGMWWISVLLGLMAALINLPISEKPVERAILAK